MTSPASGADSGPDLPGYAPIPQSAPGYSAIRTGLAYLPFPVGVVTASAVAAPLVPRMGRG